MELNFRALSEKTLILLLWWIPLSEWLFGGAGGSLALLVLDNLDGLVIACLLLVLALFACLGYRLIIRTELEAPVFLLVGVVLLSVLANLHYFPENAQGAYLFLRHLPVIWLAAMLTASERRTRRVLIHLTTVGTLGSLLVIVQAFGTEGLLFAPLLDGAPVSAPETKQGAVPGFFLQPAEMALLLLLAMMAALWLYLFGRAEGRGKRRYILIAILCFAAIVLTRKRAEGLVGLFVLVCLLVYLFRPLTRGLIASAAAIVMLVAIGTQPSISNNLEFVPGWLQKRQHVSLQKSYESVLTKRFWEVTWSKSRGWVITVIGEKALLDNGPFGSSQAPEQLRKDLAEEDIRLRKLSHFQGLEDVFWVAILLFYGPFGLAAVLLVMGVVTYHCHKLRFSHEPSMVHAGTIGLFLMGATFVLTFVERTLIMGGFSFGLWAVTGMLVGMTRRTG